MTETTNGKAFWMNFMLSLSILHVAIPVHCDFRPLRTPVHAVWKKDKS